MKRIINSLKLVVWVLVIFIFMAMHLTGVESVTY